ncbi:hypothetical protein CC86DRAFT_366899 [Ophiobolus disseminans]|uniref:Uncharacterized protein n=1 Tax=Ophiobolus disseminans TaxID=1469910 RepID=A0A6A7AEG4_9PLEO|nr:hypothetical protein CC86DRAFT_366899 [Ophiobolus disseminans]
MASTRRRSRAGDTTGPNRHQRSASHATSIVEEPTIAAQVPTTAEIAESPDESSTRPQSPISQSTKGFCKNCGNNIGEYFNLWHKVTGSYYVPALLGSYKSLLKSSGKQKGASRGTAIEGCQIQPKSCPSPSCTETPVGFTVIEGKFRGREFFKLGRIELRCEVSPDKTIVVDPIEDPASDLLIEDDSDSPSPAHSGVPVVPAVDAMEIDSRPPPSQHTGPHHVHSGQHREHHQRPQPLQHMEGNRQSLPPPSAMRSPTTLAPLQTVPPKAPSNPLPSVSPAMRPVHDVSYGTQPTSREPSAGLAGRRDFPSVASQMRSPSEVHQVNGSQYPRSPAEVTLDAIERLQTQISQNSGALAAHTRDIRRGEESFQQLETSLRREFAAQVQRQSVDIQRVDEAVARLHLEMQTMRQALEAVSHELVITRTEVQRGAATPHAQPASVPDSALEMMAQQVAVMSHKTTELDNLRITIEIMKKKIHRLESGSAPAPQSTQQTPQPSQSIPSSHVHTTASFNNTPATVSQDSPIFQTPSNPQTYRSFGPPPSTMPETIHRPEPTSSQSTGWASVNAGVKRMHPNGIESPREGAIHVPGSPKRQKVAGADPQASYAPSQGRQPQHSFENRDTGSSDPRMLSQPPTLPTQRSIPESTLASQTQQSTYAPFGTQDGPSDDSWRPESQRNIEHRPRGRGRGGGPGSRGGRVRKSMPAQVHQLGTPEWEREDWHGVPDSQAGPDGFYNHVARSGRGIARRGSGGGGGRGGYAQSERAASLGSQGVSPGFGIGSPNDPYAHTKKTRSKPIRNADGVLIRKDGRPDMRSQSSAANLRKVHARKEGELSTQGSPTGFTPTPLLYSASADAPGTPSPSGYAHPDTDAPASVQQKHSAIMGKMFPTGVDQSRKQHDYARQVFEEDHDHIAHPRTQNHPRMDAAQAAIKIKKEKFEQNRIAESQSPNDGDVDMDHTEEQEQEHEEVEDTPREQSEQYHDAQAQAEPGMQTTQEPVVPETQALDPQSSSTLSAGTMQASTG